MTSVADNSLNADFFRKSMISYSEGLNLGKKIVGKLAAVSIAFKLLLGLGAGAIVDSIINKN